MNSVINDQSFTNLASAETRLIAVLARPRAIAILCVVTLAASGWIVCAFISSWPGSDWLQVLCGPGQAGSVSAAEIAPLFVMWAAMSLAMMLPTAGPMILTYAEIADTAAHKHEPVVSPFVLAGGYVTVWLGFALTAALLQIVLLLSGGLKTASGPFAAGLFFLAGLYQFTRLKVACLTLCQRPFPFFFANWTTKARGIFALGLRQGFYCLGCCWALMLIMFAVGAMNVLWMAVLGVVMTVEKMTNGRTFSHALGVALMMVGIVLLAVEFR